MHESTMWGVPFLFIITNESGSLQHSCTVFYLVFFLGFCRDFVYTRLSLVFCICPCFECIISISYLLKLHFVLWEHIGTKTFGAHKNSFK